MSTHPHQHLPAEANNAFAGQGAVLLDIGGDIGALVVTMPPGSEGREVELRRDGADHHPHVAVVSRPVADGVQASLVFGEVPAGDYVLAWKEATQPHVAVIVRGGEVLEATWE